MEKLNTTTARREADKLCTELRGLSDQVRLKLHLASADARDAWGQLEPQLRQFEQRVERTTENAISELRSSGKELKGNLERLYAELRGQDG